MIPELHLDDGDRNTACYYVNMAFNYFPAPDDDQVKVLNETKDSHMEHIKILTDKAFKAGIEYAAKEPANEQ